MSYRKIIYIGVALVVVSSLFFLFPYKESIAQVPNQGETKELVKEEKEILYWTCGMHPSVRSDEPGKCPICNMDLVPVYKEEGMPEEEGVVSLTLSPRAKELASVRTSEVTYLPLEHTIRAVGKIDWNERQLAHITSRVPGRIDKVFVDFTGIEVKKGEPLVGLYSPNLITTQQEYLLALETLEKVKESHIQEVVQNAKSLIESAKKRLLLWGITDQQIKELEKTKNPQTHLTIYSPFSGTVIKKTAVEGKYVKEGENIYSIADLSNLWMLADIYEQELSWIHDGQEVEISSLAYPSEVFIGQISFTNPYLDEKTRSVKIRVDVPNPQGKLKPGMYVDAIIKAPISSKKETYYTCPMHPEIVSDNPGECPECGMYLKEVEGNLVLAVPKSAVLDVGARKLVYIEKDEGKYEAREVKLGPEAEAMAESKKERFFPILEGLAEGDKVVTRANFLIDSQTQLTGEAAGVYGGALGVEE